MQFFREWIAAYDDWEQDIEEIVDAGDNQVVAITRQRGRLHGSDSWVDLEAGFVYTIDDGLLVRVDVDGSRADALEAGLQDSAMSQGGLGVMRRWVELWNRGDLDGFAGLFAAEAERITDPSWMEAGPFRGRGAIRQWFEGLKDSWDAERVV